MGQRMSSPNAASSRVHASTSASVFTITANTSMMAARPVPAFTTTVSITTLISESAQIITIKQNKTLIETLIITMSEPPIQTPAGAMPAAANEPAEETTSTSVSASKSKMSSSRSISRAQPVMAATQSAQRAAATIAPTKAVTAGAEETAQAELVQENVKKPIAPPEALLGGVPNKKIDLPVTIIFLLLFIIGAVTHMATHEINGKKGHKFHLSDLMFDFCMVRTVTTTMRIVWIFNPENNSIVLAALIFQGAGTTVLFAVNTFLTQRIIRAIHPGVGWSAPATTLFWCLIISVPLIIFWNIINATLSVFLIKPQQAATFHDLVLFGSSWTLFLCTIPIIFILMAALFPLEAPPEKFGKGSLHSKILILILASSVLTIGAVIRLVTTAVPREKDNPGAINSKAVFYITGYMLEIMVVAGYALARIDLRFWVPDGCTGPGMYRPKQTAEEKVDEEKDDREKLIDEKYGNRMSVESFDYTDNTPLPPSPPAPQAQAQHAPPPPQAAYMVENQMRPGSDVSARSQTPTSPSAPRRPPRSMRWENAPRIGGDDVL